MTTEEKARVYDEKIRRCLLSHYSRYEPQEIFIDGIKMEDIVAWLVARAPHNSNK